MGTSSIVPSNPASNNPQRFTFNGKPLDTLTDESGEVWFYAADVCEGCELDNVSQAVSRLDEDEKTIIILSDNGRPQKVLLVNEPGLYALIGSSRKPEAKVFKRWINHEVLPALHKTGTYSVKTMTQAQINLAQAQAAVDLEHRIAQLEAERGAIPHLANEIEGIKDRLNRADFMLVSAFCKTQGIPCTLSMSQKWGKDAKALSLARNMEIVPIPVDDKRWPTENKYHRSILLEVCVPKPNVSKRQLKLPEEK